MPAGTALVVTSRRDELPADDPVLDWLAVDRPPAGRRVVASRAVGRRRRRLIASLVDAEPAAAFVADVLRRGEGSPFFTEQLVAAAHDVAPPLEVPAGVPAGVAQMLLRRVRSVGTAATEVAAALAVAARPLDRGGAGGLRRHRRRTLPPACASCSTPTSSNRPTDDRYRLRHALLEDTVRGNSARVPARQPARRRSGRARGPGR